MSNIIDLYNSKFIENKTVGNNNFFNNSEEIKQVDKNQNKYISSVDYSTPENFAKFGSAEEYYKLSLNYISNHFPYDASLSKKYDWINSLNELEYYIYKNEYPKSYGYVSLSGSQVLEVQSHVQEPVGDAKTIFNNGSYLTNNTIIDFVEGITFECWLRFEQKNYAKILSITGMEQEDTGAFSTITVFDIIQEPVDEEDVIRLSITNGNATQKYTFQTPISYNTWDHYAFFVKDGIAKLYVNGRLTEILEDIDIELLKLKYTFFPLGLILIKLTNTYVYEGEYEKSSIFNIGGYGKISFDELRMWNGERTVEKIGRYWFTNIDGNDTYDINNDNLLFYYKLNEGWDQEYRFLCLDSSGRKNDAEIKNFRDECALYGSGILSSSNNITTEEPSIIFKGLQYSTQVKNYYSNKVDVGYSYDLENDHMLYKKLPGWLTSDEEQNDPKHLKQIIQVISMFYDDLYNKIKEITNYKEINYNPNPDNIYPFYDKIITSMGFDVTNLFNDTSFIEAISSRNDTYIFEEKISKVKNLIYKNIYNNLSYILKSKGTEKSIKTFLASYGLNEDIIKINIYGNNIENDVNDQLKKKLLKKKTINITGDAKISSNTIEEPEQFSIETSFMIQNLQYTTSSIAGFSCDSKKYFLTVEKQQENVNRFVLNIDNGLSIERVTSSLYTEALDKNDLWTACFRKKINADTTIGNPYSYTNTLELFLINNNVFDNTEVVLSTPYEESSELTYYIGSSDGITGVGSLPSSFKYLNCSFWDICLKDKDIIIHNKDIFNYGNE